MIYLDSAATSLLKPESVPRASAHAIRHFASPGRGGYAASAESAACVLRCRELISDYFNVGDPERVVFTLNATHALNIAINTLVRPGDRVVISGLEHNSVYRPLKALGAVTDIADTPLFDKAAAVRGFSEKLAGADCAVCTHVSNVFGYILPIEEIALLCKGAGVPLIIDASQSAGVLPIDFRALGAAFIAMPGHKGLMGPQGTGVLLCGAEPQPLMHGGTGGDSLSEYMPEYLPDRAEAGTHNVAGIAGLSQGVRYLTTAKPGFIGERERALAENFVRETRGASGLSFFFSDSPAVQTGVVSAVSKSMDCIELAERLAGEGICVRAGLHCAPLAHKTAGTEATGTVRFSFSPFNTAAEVGFASAALKKILK